MSGMSLLRVFEARVFWSIAILLGVLATFFFSAIERALIVPDLHIDGVYQTLSALNRLSVGDSVGKDFYFYLGLGPLYILYPFFLIAGGNAAASIFASHFVVSVTFVFTFLFLAKVSFSRLTWPSVVILGLLFSWVLELIFVDYSLYFKYPNYFSFLDPGNSLRPLRRFIPILTGCMVVYVCAFHSSSRLLPFFLGFIGGIAIAWSNDYGFPTFGAGWFFVAWFVWCRREGAISLIAATVKYVVSAVVVFFLLISFVTEGHAVNWLHYNFIGVSSDQWWYYKPFLKDRQWDWFSFWDLADRGENWPLSVAIVSSFFLIPALFVFSFLKKKFYPLVLAYVGLCLFAGAFLTEYLGHRDDYYWAAIMPWLMFVLLATFFAGLKSVASPTFASFISEKCARSGLSLLFLICFFFMCLRLLGAAVAYQDARDNIESQMIYDIRLGGFVSAETAAYLEATAKLTQFKSKGTIFLVEEYFGLASAVGLGVNPTPFDSVIHALGEGSRKYYLDGLDRADFVVTTNPMFSKWQSWSLSHNWWFYRYVIENFSVIERFPTVVLWGRIDKEDIISPSVRECEIVYEDSGAIIQFDENLVDRFVEVSFEYQLRKKPDSRYLLLLENGLSATNRYTSFDTSFSSAVTPVFLSSRIIENGAPLYIYPNPGGRGKVRVNHCVYRERSLQSGAIHFDERYVPLDMDFDVVRDGLDLERPVIYFEATLENLKAFTVGRHIRFSNGETREIVFSRKQFSSNVLEVGYFGESLGRDVDGFPFKIEVID